MLIPTESSETQKTIGRSRFIAILRPISSPEEVRILLKEIRGSYRGCNHVVHAFVVGVDGVDGVDGGHQGMSDDGEPSGTGGRQLLNRIKAHGMTNLAVFVVRFFGGVKLGVRGLADAYRSSAEDVLLAVPRVELIEYQAATLHFNYQAYQAVVRLIDRLGGRIRESEFRELVTLYMEIPVSRMEALRKEFLEVTAGGGGFATE